MRIALAQIASTDDVERNLRLIAGTARRASDEGADLVVFPEYAMYDKPRLDESFLAVAESVDGPFIAEVGRLAAAVGAHVVVGMVEANGRERPFNTVVLVGPDGTPHNAYRKIHLFDAYGCNESAFISPGEDLSPDPVEVAAMSVGFMTCYDLRFPELGRLLATKGADLLVVPASWVPGSHKVAQWRSLLAARAIENTCWVTGVCQAAPLSIGTSLVCGPDGVVRSELGPTPGLILTDVGRGDLDAIRRTDRNLALRRLGLTSQTGPVSSG